MTGLIKFLIIFWMSLGIVSVLVGAYFLITQNIRDGLTFIAFGAVSAVMVWMNKRRLRIYGNAQPRVEKKEEKKK